MFGEDIESIEPEEKYEESIAERVKTRRQNTQRKYMEEEKKVKKDLVMIMIAMDGLVDLV